MAKEPTTVKDNTRTPSGDTPNVSNIVFPRDKTGMTSMLRKEGVRSAGRIYGKQENLEVFLETLRVLAQHAKNKQAHDKLQQAQSAAKAKEQAAVERAKAVKDQLLEAERLMKVAEAAMENAVAQQRNLPSTVVGDE